MRLNTHRYKGDAQGHDAPDGYAAPEDYATADDYDRPDGYDDPGYDAAGYDGAGYDGAGYDGTGYDGTGEYGPWDGEGEPDDFPGPRDPSAYWRRRFIILAGGIAALGLCVWLFPGGKPAPAHTAASSRASIAALAKGSALPAAAYGTTFYGAKAKKSPAASPSATPSPAHSASHPATARPAKPAAPSKSAQPSKPAHPAKSARPARHHKARGTGTSYHPKPTATAKARPSAGAAAEPRCAPKDIVLSLFTSKASYPGSALPSFSVYAVSTSATACTLSYGPGSVHVAVTRQGHVVWDSAACRPAAEPKLKFTLGVPRVLTMTWNRSSSGPAGCAGSLTKGDTGTFEAVAVTAGQSSPVHSFKLEKEKKTSH